MQAIELKPNSRVELCPECGNNSRFNAHSNQVAEDHCEVWVVCVCGFDPTRGKSSSRYEDVWGGLDRVNVHNAIDCWNNAIQDARKVDPNQYLKMSTIEHNPSALRGYLNNPKFYAYGFRLKTKLEHINTLDCGI